MTKHQNLVISFAIVGIILCAVMISGCTDYETYTSDYYGYSMKYPDTWEYIGYGSNFAVQNPETQSTVAVRVTETSQSSINSFIELKKKIDADLATGAHNFYTYDADYVYVDEELVDEDYITLNGYDAYEAEHIYPNYHEKKIYVLKGKYVYELTYEAPTKYKDDLKTANKIMESFNLD